MTSLNESDLPESIQNLLKAAREFVEPERIPDIIRLVYDNDGKPIAALRGEETNEQHIIITPEELEVCMTDHIVKDGKLVKVPRHTVAPLNVVPGDKWKTTEENMLIIGNEKGWDARTS